MTRKDNTVSELTVIKGHKVLALLIVSAFAVATVALIATAPAPAASCREEIVYPVETLNVRSMTIRTRVTGYGESSPDRVWSAVSQVAGQIVWVSPKLKNGGFVTAGEELLLVDDREYLLAQRAAVAILEQKQASIAELEAGEANLQRRRDLLKKIVNLNEKGLERQKQLLHAKAVAPYVVEAEEVNVLQQKALLEEIESELNLMPARLDKVKNELLEAQVNLEKTDLDLTYTRIIAPFDGRIDQVQVELAQFISGGNTLFQLDSILQMEIPVSLTAPQIKMVFDNSPDIIAQLRANEITSAGSISVRSSSDGRFLGEGYLLRLGAGVESTTRMVELVVGVKNPYEAKDGSQILPFLKGALCVVEFRGEPIEALIVPRYALHDSGRLYVVSPDSTLEIRQVEIKYCFGNYALVEHGVVEGECIVLSDIYPAFPGMKLQAVPNEEFYAGLEEGIGMGEGGRK